MEPNTRIKPITSINVNESLKSITDNSVARDGSKAVNIPAREEDIYFKLDIKIR